MKSLFCAGIVFAALAVATVVSATEIEGVYDLQGSTANGAGFKGTATIIKNESTYNVAFNFDTHTDTGVGVIVGDQFSVAMTRPKGTDGVVAFQIKGATLTGVWAWAGEKKTGTMTLTKR